MTPDVIIQAISTVGFPIVCCAALFWKVDKQDTQHREEMDSMVKAIENNTIALQKILDKVS